MTLSMSTEDMNVNWSLPLPSPYISSSPFLPSPKWNDSSCSLFASYLTQDGRCLLVKVSSVKDTSFFALDHRNIIAHCWDESGKYLLTCSRSSLVIFEVDSISLSGNIKWKIECDVHPRCVCLTSNCDFESRITVAVGGSLSTLHHFSLESDETETIPLSKVFLPISAISFSPDGKYLATCDYGTYLRIMCRSKGTILFEDVYSMGKKRSGRPTSMNYSPSGDVIFVAMAEGLIILWRKQSVPNKDLWIISESFFVYEDPLGCPLFPSLDDTENQFMSCFACFSPSGKYLIHTCQSDHKYGENSNVLLVVRNTDTGILKFVCHGNEKFHRIRGLSMTANVSGNGSFLSVFCSKTLSATQFSWPCLLDYSESFNVVKDDNRYINCLIEPDGSCRFTLCLEGESEVNVDAPFLSSRVFEGTFLDMLNSMWMVSNSEGDVESLQFHSIRPQKFLACNGSLLPNGFFIASYCCLYLCVASPNPYKWYVRRVSDDVEGISLQYVDEKKYLIKYSNGHEDNWDLRDEDS